MSTENLQDRSMTPSLIASIGGRREQTWRTGQMETKYGVVMLACMALPFLLTGMLEIFGWLKRNDK